MIEITIDGRKVEVDPKQPLVRACHEHASDVPTYCYHPGLSPVGSCRICQVEVQQGNGPPRVVVACRTPVAEGMVVNTQAPGACDARRECLEFLLKNHPLDCPICDKAGECDLQDYSFAEGQTEGRSVEPRRKLEKRKSLGDVIVLDQERCILCSRCVRFFEEVTEKPQLTVSDMGARSVISTFADRPLQGNYQGNVADICPVGALTLKEFRFQARVWNLRKSFSTCGECSRGCAITVEVLRGKDVKRVRPRYSPEVNQWWMCDTGRFALEPYEGERAPAALMRGNEGLVAGDPVQATALAAQLVSLHAPGAVIASPWVTVEEGELLLDFARRVGAPAWFVSPAANGLKDDLLHTGDPCPNRRGLLELGFEARTAAEILTALPDMDTAVLVGERVVELIGEADLDALSSAVRLVALEARPPQVQGIVACLGVPSAVERVGTWVNVDGHRGTIAASRAAALGVPPTTQTIQNLIDALAPAEVEA